MPKTVEDIKQEIDRVLAVLRESIVMHGGNVELVDFDETNGRVTVRMQGACVGCPLAEMTLKAGIEETLCELVSEVREVVQIA